MTDAFKDTQEQEVSTVTCTQTRTEIHMNHHHEGPEHQYSSSLSEKTQNLKVSAAAGGRVSDTPGSLHLVPGSGDGF